MEVIIKALVLFCVVFITNADVPKEEISAFDYHRKVGISRAIRLRKAEEESLLLNATGIPTIVGGAYTDIVEVPYQVGLIISLFFFLTSVCGGSLISSTRVLTAAHCHSDGILEAKSFTVVLGSNKLFFGGVRIETMDTSVHPNWNPSELENDLCILRIPVISFTDEIKPVALPSPNDSSTSFTDWTALASGYGLTKDNSSILRNQRLSSVKLYVISNEECAKTFGSLIRKGNVCTSGSKGQSTCRGDSGGPLVVFIDHNRVLIGVTSFGMQSGCESGYPAAYSRVTYFMPWIINQ